MQFMFRQILYNSSFLTNIVKWPIKIKWIGVKLNAKSCMLVTLSIIIFLNAIRKILFEKFIILFIIVLEFDAMRQ